MEDAAQMYFSVSPYMTDLSGKANWDNPLAYSADVSDAFFWGCSDGENVLEEDVDDWVQAWKDYPLNGGLLWTARKRQMRPQGAYFTSIAKTHWHLFEEAGPKRETGFGNPAEPGQYHPESQKEEIFEPPVFRIKYYVPNNKEELQIVLNDYLKFDMFDTIMPRVNKSGDIVIVEHNEDLIDWEKSFVFPLVDIYSFEEYSKIRVNENWVDTLIFDKKQRSLRKIFLI